MLKKKAFTLIEVIIAGLLTSILVSVIFVSLSQSAKLSHKLEGVKNQVIGHHEAYVRLSHLFQSLEGEIEGPSNKLSPFCTMQVDESEFPSLNFFYSSLDMEPNYSGKLRGNLHLNRNKELIFMSWDIEGVQTRKEILMDQVDALAFSFLSKTYDKNQKSKVQASQLWNEEQHGMPDSMMLIITRDGKEIELPFFFKSDREGWKFNP